MGLTTQQKKLIETLRSDLLEYLEQHGENVSAVKAVTAIAHARNVDHGWATAAMWELVEDGLVVYEVNATLNLAIDEEPSANSASTSEED